MTSPGHTSPYTRAAEETGAVAIEAKVKKAGARSPRRVTSAVEGAHDSKKPIGPDLGHEALVAVRRSLLEWYGKQRRALPWRATRDPYCIWVSEVMLQQTQVATVIGYYERWLRHFPDVAALAAADTEDVLRAWEGLGYYSRARNLQRAAQRIVLEHGGKLPSSVPQLLALPGIGRYSAGAIASIAFAADEPAIDGNIVRVLTRLFGLRGDPKRAPLSARLWQLAGALLPAGRAGDFNQALMELGATTCTPRAPRCATCPVRTECVALRQDRVLEYPQAAPRPAMTEEHRVAGVVRRQGRVLVVRAPAGAPRWAGMWQFPDVRIDAGMEPAPALEARVLGSTGVRVAADARVLGLRHQVTRFRIAIDVYACRALGGRARAIDYGEIRWLDPEDLSALPMPAAHRKIARSLA
jgi:A/G-specific adenine glycosylase